MTVGDPATSRVARWLGIPGPEYPDPRWHVSPGVDTLAYAFSWAFVLVPMLFVGDAHRVDYLPIYLLVLAFTDVHRHYGLPYTYLDREVFARHPVRFTVFPAVMLVAFLAAPFFRRAVHAVPGSTVACGLVWLVLLVQELRRDRDGGGTPLRLLAPLVLGALALAAMADLAFRTFWPWLVAALATSLALELVARRRGRSPRFVAPLLVAGVIALVVWVPSVTVRTVQVLMAVTVFAGIWNIWHVYSQKYGILRMYAAKAGRRVPGWVDRGLVWGWLPLYVLWLGTEHRSTIVELFPAGREILAPLFATVDALGLWFLVPTAALVVFFAAAFLYWEARAHGFRNTPRLVMATGTTLLAASFLLVHPLKAYLAYAFTHAVEYMVFVWAFQRRRYRAPLPHEPLIARFLRYPVLVYVGFALAMGLCFVYLKYSGRWILQDEAPVRLFDISAWEWIGYWTVFQSMVHFYFDGFLWKMRARSVRDTIGAAEVAPAVA